MTLIVLVWWRSLIIREYLSSYQNMIFTLHVAGVCFGTLQLLFQRKMHYLQIIVLKFVSFINFVHNIVRFIYVILRV